MSYSVGTITAFVDQLDMMELHTAAVFGNNTPAFVDTRVGIKGSVSVHKLDSTAYMRAIACSFSPTGDDALTQATLTTLGYDIPKEWCPSDLDDTYAKKLMPNGSLYDESAAIQEVVDNHNRTVARLIEIADWQGDVTSTNVNLKRYNGIHTLITSAGGYIAPTGSGSLAMNETNIRTALRACLTAVPEALAGDADFTFKCSYSIYQTYLNKLAVDNLYHITGMEGNTFQGLPIENSQYKLFPVHGMTGLLFIYGFKKDNVIMGVNEPQDAGTIGGSRLWFSNDDMKLKYDIRGYRGFVCVRTAEVVRYAFSS